DQIAEAAELADRRRIARRREDVIPGDCLRTRAEPVDSPDRPDRPAVGHIRLKALRSAIFDARRVERLLVLPPTGRTHEALILDIDPLPTDGHDGLGQA